MIPLSAYVVVSAILFATGLLGVLIRRNFIIVLMAVEIIRHLRKYFEGEPIPAAIVYSGVGMSCGLVAVWLLNAESVRWDKPLLVQLTLVAHRAVSIWTAGSVAGCYIASRWAVTMKRNLPIHLAIASCSWAIGAAAQGILLQTRDPWVRNLASSCRSAVDLLAVGLWLLLLWPAGEIEIGTDGYELERRRSRKVVLAVLDHVIKAIRTTASRGVYPESF